MWVPLRAARIGVRIGFVAGGPSSPDEAAETRSATRRIFHYQRPHVASQPRRRVGGVADLSAVETVIDEVCDPLPQGCVVVNKSTVPVGTAVRTAEMLNRLDVTVGAIRISSAKVPQWKVFLHPDRIMVGCDAQDTAERVAAFVHSTRATDRTHRLTEFAIGASVVRVPPAMHRRVYLLRSVTSAATLAIYVLLPRTLVTQTTSRILCGKRDADSLDSGACAPRVLPLPLLARRAV
jgi:hypothetical protein